MEEGRGERRKDRKEERKEGGKRDSLPASDAEQEKRIFNGAENSEDVGGVSSENIRDSNRKRRHGVSRQKGRNKDNGRVTGKRLALKMSTIKKKSLNGFIKKDLSNRETGRKSDDGIKLPKSAKSLSLCLKLNEMKK